MGRKQPHITTHANLIIQWNGKLEVGYSHCTLIPTYPLPHIGRATLALYTSKTDAEKAWVLSAKLVTEKHTNVHQLTASELNLILAVTTLSRPLHHHIYYTVSHYQPTVEQALGDVQAVNTHWEKYLKTIELYRQKP